MSLVKVERLCPRCLKNRGKNVKLKVLRLNFSQGALACPSKNCPYPFVTDGVDEFVNFKDRPEIDPSVVQDTEDSWSSVLEQIRTIINTARDSSPERKPDVVNDGLASENGLEEFSSYASNFIDALVKSCEVKNTKSNESSIENMCFDFENSSLNCSGLDPDLNLSLLSLSTPQDDFVNSLDILPDLDCFVNSDRQTQPVKSEENNQSNTDSVMFDGYVSELGINSKSSDGENYIDMISRAEIVFEMPNDIISNVNEQQNNSQLTPVNCISNNLLNSSGATSSEVDSIMLEIANDVTSNNGNKQQSNSQVEPVNCFSNNLLNSSGTSPNKVVSSGSASPNKVVSSGSGAEVSFKVLKYKTNKITCATSNALSETASSNKIGETIRDGLSTNMLPVVKLIKINPDTLNDMQHSNSLLDEVNESSKAVQSSELNDTANTVERTNLVSDAKDGSKSGKDLPITCLRVGGTNSDEHYKENVKKNVNESSKAVQTSELNDTANTVKQTNLSDAKGRSKSGKDLPITCSQVGGTNSDEHHKENVKKIVNESSNAVQSSELNDTTNTVKQTNLSDAKDCSKSGKDLPITCSRVGGTNSDEHYKENVNKNVTFYSIQKKDSCRTNNKMPKIEVTSPEVQTKGEIRTRSASKKKQGMPNSLGESSNHNNEERSEISFRSSKIDVDHQNTVKTETTADLPIKHLSDTVVSSNKTMKKVKNSSPKVDSRMSTRSASKKKQGTSNNLGELSNDDKKSSGSSNINIDYPNTDKTETTVDLLTLVSSGISFTWEQSDTSLTLANLELCPQKNELRASASETKSHYGLREKRSISGSVNDSFIHGRRLYRSGGSRRRAKDTTKKDITPKKEPCDELPSLYSYDDILNFDAVNEDIKCTVKNELDTTFQLEDCRFDTKTYPSAKAVKQKKKKCKRSYWSVS